MEQVLNVFGIDWKLLLINAANFLLLLLALTYFFYKPLMRMLDLRREKIARGVEAAKKAEEELKEFEASRGAMLAKAGKEADQVISQARNAGAEKQREIVSQAEAAAARALAEAEAQARDLKEKAVQESKQEVAKLVVLGMEKALKQK
jgi:F-type H+-transporting ATPase subunit b